MDLRNHGREPPVHSRPRWFPSRGPSRPAPHPAPRHTATPHRRHRPRNVDAVQGPEHRPPLAPESQRFRRPDDAVQRGCAAHTASHRADPPRTTPQAAMGGDAADRALPGASAAAAVMAREPT